jgi:translocation protein SEC72
MADLTHFDLLPIHMDPQSKAINPSAGASSRALAAELDSLNTLHRSLLALDAPAIVPPPPMPINPKRSANIAKLRDNANAEYKKGKFGEAIRLYTLGLQMALTRPPWEPSQIVRDEASMMLSNRAQAHMALQSWAEGGVDAEASVELRRVANAKSWWRRGKCLLEMGRLDECKEWLGKALEVDSEEADLVALLKEVERRIEKERAGPDVKA